MRARDVSTWCAFTDVTAVVAFHIAVFAVHPAHRFVGAVVARIYNTQHTYMYVVKNRGKKPFRHAIKCRSSTAAATAHSMLFDSTRSS